jgi:hypothetical protein
MSGPESTPDPNALPPGVHLSAEVMAADGIAHQLRIVGDDRRGYLLAGLDAISSDPEAEFWFAGLEAAQQAAVPFGVAVAQWSEIASLDDVVAGDGATQDTSAG